MSKNKQRKEKSKKLYSSSSGEDEKVPGGHCLSKGNHSKRKESGRDTSSSHVRDRQQKEYPLPPNKDDSKSRHKFKKAVYKRSDTQRSEHIPVGTEDGRKRTKTVDIHSRSEYQPLTSSTKTKSVPQGNSTFIPVGHTVESGLSQLRSSYSKDTCRQVSERTTKHDPHISSHQKGSSKPIRPAEYKHKPPSLNTSCKRKSDGARVTTTEQSTTTTSSVEESTARGGWKSLDKPHEDERKDNRGAKSSNRAPPHRSTKQYSTSTTRAASPKKEKPPTLTPGHRHVAPGSPCVQPAGGSFAPQRPAVKFKIPKKTRPTSYLKDDREDDNNDKNEKGGVSPRTTNICRSSKPADLNGSDGVDPKETGPVQSVHSTAVDPFISSLGVQDRSSTGSHQPFWQCINMPPSSKQNTHNEGARITDDSDHEMQVVEALHQARSERRLEVDVVQSYGELTRMDTDAPDDGENHTFKNDLIVVLDTNILLSHLDYVKKIRSHGLGAMGFPVVLIPWVVLQELDSLKNGKRPQGSVAHLASPAVHFIYSCLKRQEPGLWGQSMQQASEGNRRLNAENNDDRILQCCLQYQILHPESALILCTNDKNLCSKALLSGVKALSKADLVEESGGLRDAALPSAPAPFPRPLQHGPAETQGGDGGEAVADGAKVSLCAALLEDCLKEVLSHILEVEMKAAYDDLWQDIIHVKPPWEASDILRCMRKHWFAVFGNVIPRNLLPALVNLSDFFTPGKIVEQDSVLAALREAGELLDGFGKTKDSYGGRVSTAIATLDTIECQLAAQPEHIPDEPVVDDAMMSDHEGKQALSLQVSHQEVWALFENIWANVCQISSALFAALHFDPGTMRRTVPGGAPPPAEDVLACLHKLLPMVTQLLQAFSRVLSSDFGMEESQALLSFIHASQIVSINAHLSTRDLIVCFSQQEYREKLRVGGAQLTELKVRLEYCVGAISQSVPSSTWP